VDIETVTEVPVPVDVGESIYRPFAPEAVLDRFLWFGASCWPIVLSDHAPSQLKSRSATAGLRRSAWA